MISFTKEQQEYIDSHYMLLPVDEKGIPVRMRDAVEGVPYYDDETVKGTVSAIHVYDTEPAKVYVRVDCGDGSWTVKELPTARCRHVKPRTVEDVLAELEGLRGYGNSTYEAVVTRAAELAEELRELLKEES